MASTATASRPLTSSSILSSTWIFGATIALSAFLLFQVQPVIGKYVLPWFGGTSAVWTTCLLVFQTLLLAGYAYAHLLASRLKPAAQVRVHLAVIGLALALMAVLAFAWGSPITPGPAWKPQNVDAPVWDIVRLLVAAIGLPFFVVSTSGSLLQRWYSLSFPGRSPYRLYALSNAGSLLGLLSYPFIFEPALRIRTQAWLWTAGFVLFAGGCAGCALALGQRTNSGSIEVPSTEADPAEARGGLGRWMLWLLLPFCACVMLLAGTNRITQEIAVIPLLWVLPLSLYLVSFIICFDNPRWYRREIFYPLYGLGLLAAYAGLERLEFTLLLQIGLALVAMFSIFMICHGELAKLKPHSRELTAFYLMIALGGALGGVFVTIVAPRVFTGYWEFQIVMCVAGGLAAIVLWLDRSSWFHRAPAGTAMLIAAYAALVPVILALVAGVPRLHELLARVHYYEITTAIALTAVLIAFKTGLQPQPSRIFRWVQASGCLLIVGFSVLFVRQFHRKSHNVLARERSFFGTLAVMQSPGAVGMKHGETIHGWQLTDPAMRDEPTGYFMRETGIGLLLGNYRQSRGGAPIRVGIVGLGVGTLAAYAQPGDHFRYYEINPQVLGMSSGPRPWFTFLKDSRGQVDVVMGDGRLSLERELAQGQPQQFDVLVLDAFSSDSVPVHLITREAVQMYLKHLRTPQSVLVIHVSNRSVDLAPVATGLAREFGLFMIRAGVQHPGGGDPDWILLSRDRDALLGIPPLAATARQVDFGGPAPLWTDDYSNLLAVLRLR